MLEILWKDVKESLKYLEDGTFIRLRDNKILKGYETGRGYKQLTFKYVRYSFHRFVFFYHFGFFPENLDHINGDNSDNRIENLRTCSIYENAQNVKKNITNKSGTKGVSYDAARKNWRVEIRSKKEIFFIRVKTKKEAVKIAKEKRKELHGNFARN